jgi:hypothetical protein
MTKKRSGLWANIRKKRKRIENGSAEKMRAKGEQGRRLRHLLRRSVILIISSGRVLSLPY